MSTPSEYAAVVIDLLLAHYEMQPDRYASCHSWQDLHDVCDANEFLSDAAESLGESVDCDSYPKWNEAQDIVDAVLWAPIRVADAALIDAVSSDARGAALAAAAFVEMDESEARRLLADDGGDVWSHFVYPSGPDLAALGFDADAESTWNEDSLTDHWYAVADAGFDAQLLSIAEQIVAVQS